MLSEKANSMILHINSLIKQIRMCSCSGSNQNNPAIVKDDPGRAPAL